jgi:hypothetical protein
MTVPIHVPGLGSWSSGIHEPNRSSSGSWAMFRGDAPGLRRTTAGFVLKIDLGERLPAVVADDEAGVGLFDGSGRREAADISAKPKSATRWPR